MKKTIVALALTVTLGVTTLNANAATNVKTKATVEKLCFTYCTTTVTETNSNGCLVTYKIVTTYFLCIPICSTKTIVSTVCGGNNGGGGGGNS